MEKNNNLSQTVNIRIQILHNCIDVSLTVDKGEETVDGILFAS